LIIVGGTPNPKVNGSLKKGATLFHCSPHAAHSNGDNVYRPRSKSHGTSQKGVNSTTWCFRFVAFAFLTCYIDQKTELLKQLLADEDVMRRVLENDSGVLRYFRFAAVRLTLVQCCASYQTFRGVCLPVPRRRSHITRKGQVGHGCSISGMYWRPATQTRSDLF